MVHPAARPYQNDEELAIDTIRVVAAEMVQAANSGHPGMPMGMAPVAHVLWTQFMTYSPSNPLWWNRDRFVLSNGHGCALQYILLHLAGYKLSLDDLKQFRKLGSLTPGHPEAHVTDGIEVTTGPLGQGISNAVGLAWAESHLAAKYNKEGFELFNNYTYCFLGDGCMQEGVASEASSLAGHWGLNKLIAVYDDNHVTIDGDTDLSFTEDVKMRYEAYGWRVIVVSDGDHDLNGIAAAFKEAHTEKEKPVLIQLKTTIGFGAKKQGTEAVHGAALGEEELKNVKKVFGFDPEKHFDIKQQVYDIYHKAAAKGKKTEEEWNSMLKKYEEKYPTEYKEIKARFARELPSDWQKAMPEIPDKADATRNVSGVVLNALAEAIPALIVGSADLTPSNKTELKKQKSYQKTQRDGRYIHFGIREHGMAAIGNGISAYGALIPTTATFTNFIEYCFPAVRLAALSSVQQFFVTTHDSIGLGEDGPTHQPIEALLHCRSTPGVMMFRPADGNETIGSYIAALNYKTGPSVLAFCRQNVPQLPTSSAEKTGKGGYVLSDPPKGGKPDLVLIGTGSETYLVVEAAEKLQNDFKVRVVSMPCTSLFDRQSVEYRRSVLTPGVLTISVEALGQYGWERYSHVSLGMQTFGASGDYKSVLKKFGYTTDQIVENVRARAKAFHQEAKELGGEHEAIALLPTHFSFFQLPDVGHHLFDQKKSAPRNEQ